MKITSLTLSSLLIWNVAIGQETKIELEDKSPQAVIEGILQKSEELAEVQDELSADVMELVESQTVPQVVEMLEQVEKIMAEVTDELIEGETGGPTMAAETEIIEKILAAAKKKQQSSEESSPESKESMGAMMDMMERMTGKNPGKQEGEGPPKEGGDQPSDKGDGGGSTGESDSKNENSSGKIGDEDSVRTIPKGSAPPGESLPNEFRKLLDAYNRNNPARK